jgi:Flp pilus assembly protein TadD
MKGRRIALAACALALAAASGAILLREHKRPRLPEPVAYPGRPEPFGRALAAASARARSGSASPDDVRSLARLYQANGLRGEARACYAVLRSRPGGLSARDHYCLAAMALDESDLGRGKAELGATLAADPSYVPARIALADVLFKTGDPAGAEAQFEDAAKSDHGDPRAELGLARIDLQRGRDDVAVARLTRLVRAHPESAIGAALLAQVLDRRGDSDRANALRALSQQAHDRVPADPWMAFMLADCYDLQRLGLAFEQFRIAGQMDEALPLLDRLQELDPGGWMPAMLRGWSLKEAGRYKEAARSYTAALERGGDPEKICPLLGAAMMSGGDDKGAAAALAPYHEKLPRSIPILLSYSEAAVRMKDDALARQLLGQVLEAEPDLYMPNMTMAQILWDSGDRDGAARHLRRVARVFPADIDARGFLGQYYLAKPDPWSAIAPLEEALALAQPADARRGRLTAMLGTTYLMAGSAEAAEGHFPKALELADKSLRLAPDDIRAYALQANIQRATGDYAKAKDAVARMAELKPADASIRMNLGDMKFRLGDADGARSDWREALNLAPAGAAGLRADINRRLAGGLPEAAP